MANSLRNKIKHFCYKGELSESERNRLINALDDTELKQQPCDDCISREDILNAIETWDKFGVNAEQKLIRWQDHYVPYVHLDDVRNAIANMPSVTPKASEQTRWIPVSERLPEDYGKYICTMSDDNVQECGFVPYGRKGLILGWSTCEADGFKKLDYRDIKAWMPLPEPYAESEDEE